MYFKVRLKFDQVVWSLCEAIGYPSFLTKCSTHANQFFALQSSCFGVIIKDKLFEEDNHQSYWQ